MARTGMGTSRRKPRKPQPPLTLEVVDAKFARIFWEMPDLLPSQGTPERATADALVAAYLEKMAYKVRTSHAPVPPDVHQTRTNGAFRGRSDAIPRTDGEEQMPLEGPMTVPELVSARSLYGSPSPARRRSRALYYATHARQQPRDRETEGRI